MKIADPENSNHPPDIQFILSAFKIIAKRCELIKSRQPLDDFKKQVDLYLEILNGLGTDLHEVAAKKLGKAIEATSKDAGKWWLRPWVRSKKHQSMVNDMRRAEMKAKSEHEEILKNIKASRPTDTSPQPLIETHEKLLAIMQDPLDLNMSSVFGAATNPLFQIDMAVFWLHFRFYQGKIANFSVKHSLVLLLPIFIVGFILSKTATWASSLIASFSGFASIAIGLGIAYLIFKRYIIDPAVNKLLKKLEARRLRFLSFSWISLVAMQALQTDASND